MPKLLPYPKAGSARYRSPINDRANLFAFVRKSLRMFRRRWWIALVTLAIGSATGVYYARTQPDKYSASSRLSVAPKVAFSQRSGDRATITEEKNNFVQAQIEYLRGATLLSRVEEKMQDFRDKDGSIPQKSLAVNQGAGSTFILSVESTSLDYARRFSRTWAQEFLAFKVDMLSDVARRSMDRTRAELSQREELVEEARIRLDQFLQEHQIATSQDTGNAAQERLADLQRRQQSVRLARERLEILSAEELAEEKTSAASAASAATAASAAVTMAATEKAAGEVAGASSDAGDLLKNFGGRATYRDLRLTLRRYQAEWDRRSADLKPRHPYMVELARSMEEVQREIKDQLELVDEMRLAQIKSLKDEEAVLEKQIESRRSEVVSLREISREYTRLSETYAGHKSALDQLNRDLQALSKLNSEEEEFKILEEGVGSSVPVGPNRLQIIVMGVAVGLLSGVGLIFLLHRLDDRIESAEDLEKALEEPILGQIPIVSRRDVRNGMVSVDFLQPNNIFVEAFRGVRSSVMFGDLGGTKQVLMATSSVPGDGKSTFTVNFAITLAKAGNRVLLVDADLRRGTVAQYFDIPSEPGLTEVLSGLENWTDVLNATQHRTLLVITQGRQVSNPGELLLSKVIRRFIEEARRDFDYIIFDSPPVIGMDDAASLASNCDGLIFVYRVGATSLKLAKLAVNTTRQRGGHILGLILNGVSIGSPDYYYTAYYYSHYAYEAKAGGRKALPEPTEGSPHRPEGARLLTALRETGSETSAPSARSALLDDDASAEDIQVIEPPSGKDGRPGSASKA